MRTFFLFLSRQKQLRNWMETSRWARRLSARFVAGDNLPEALAPLSESTPKASP